MRPVVWRMALALAVSALAGIGPTSVGAEPQSPLSAILKGGAAEGIVFHEWVPLDLPDLIERSEAILRLRISGARSVETDASPYVATVYRADILDLLQDRASLRLAPGMTISFTRDGGELMIGQQRYVATESEFPQFTVGDEYLLFMKWDDYRKGLAVVGGGQGAFRIDGNLMAHQIAHIAGDTPEERPSLDQRLDRLRELILRTLAVTR